MEPPPYLNEVRSVKTCLTTITGSKSHEGGGGMQGVYCGLDFHKNISEMCFMDSDGKVVETARLANDKALLHLSNRSQLHVAIEASGAVFDMSQKIEALGHKVTVINSSQFRGIGITGKKNDKNDALALATALRLGFLPEVFKKSIYARRLRSLLASRDFVIRSRVNTTNHIRGILREYGLPLPQGHRNFIEIAQIKIAKMDCEIIKATLLGLFEQVKSLLDEESKIDKALRCLAGEDERVCRLRTVPGVGEKTAMALVAAIDDVQRFKDAKSFASYLGMTPRESSSGAKVRYGSLTKCGPEMVRRYLIHGARTLFRYRSEGKSKTIDWLIRLEKRAGTNKAIVALAHKNARICFAILRDSTEFQKRAS
jgi:transposase